MNKFYLLLVGVLLHSVHLKAQSNTIIFDYEKNALNDNQPIPAEKTFSISGRIGMQVMIVEVLIYNENSRQKKPPIYQNIWKRSFDAQTQQFYLPISYKLRGNDEYDFVINYYRQASDNEVQNLRNDLLGAIEAYLQQNLVLSGNHLDIRNPTNKVMNDLNTLVKHSLAYYKNQTGIVFEGFSDLVREKLRIIEKEKGGVARNLFLGKSKKEANLLNRNQNLNDLKALIIKEVSFVLNAGVHVIGDSKVIESVATQKTPNFLTIHAGYSGTAFYEKDYNYFSGLNAGITIPWGNQNLSKAFWRKSAVVAGVYFNNFKAGTEEISGPILGRPWYVGIGYKIFPFVRLTGGVTALETGKNMDTGISSQFEKDVYFKPFVGLVIDIDIWLNLRK